jgi:hypothetical protein
VVTAHEQKQSLRRQHTKGLTRETPEDRRQKIDERVARAHNARDSS